MLPSPKKTKTEQAATDQEPEHVVDTTSLSTITCTTWKGNQVIVKRNLKSYCAQHAIENEAYMLECFRFLIPRDDQSIYMHLLHKQKDELHGRTTLILEKAHEDLFEYLCTSDPPIKFEDASLVARQVMKRLLFMVDVFHKHGVSHNDIKPENIVIRDPNSGFDSCALIDFGFSTYHDVNTSESFILDPTKMHKARVNIFNVGTKAFRHPKLICHQPLDWREIDLFSCGIACYVLLFQDFPCNSNNPLSNTDHLEIQRKFTKPDWHTHPNFKFDDTIVAHSEFPLWVDFIYCLCSGKFAHDASLYLQHAALF